MNSALATTMRVRLYLDAIKFEHTIFALPFAYLGMILAAHGWPGWLTFFWITVAMVGARTGAMAANRLIDADVDRKNPRTMDRALPAHRISRAEMFAVASVGFALLHVAAWQLNLLALALAPVAMVAVTLYSYTKRFTWTSHWVLGLADGIAPMGGWIAVRGDIGPDAVVLALVVMFWIAGFDVLYALQDINFDRQRGLHSVPAKFGTRCALHIARMSHALSVGALIVLGAIAPLAWPYWVGVGLIGALLVHEHMMLRKDLAHLNIAFFNINGYVAITALVFTIGGVWVG